MTKKQYGECNFTNFNRYFFGMSFDVPAFKVHVFQLQVTLNFELNEMNSSSTHSNSNFAHHVVIH